MSDVIIHISEPELMPSDTQFIALADLENYPDEVFDNIIVHDLLDYIRDNEISEVLAKISNKLRVGGSLSIQSLDLKHLCVAIAFDEIDNNEVKKLLYPNKRSIHSLHDMVQYLEGADLKTIIKKYSNDVEYFIIASKL